ASSAAARPATAQRARSAAAAQEIIRYMTFPHKLNGNGSKQFIRCFAAAKMVPLLGQRPQAKAAGRPQGGWLVSPRVRANRGPRQATAQLAAAESYGSPTRRRGAQTLTRHPAAFTAVASTPRELPAWRPRLPCCRERIIG